MTMRVVDVEAVELVERDKGSKTMPHRPLLRAIGGGPLAHLCPCWFVVAFLFCRFEKPTWNIFWLGSRSSPTRPPALACILCQTSQPKQPKQPGKAMGRCCCAPARNARVLWWAPIGTKDKGPVAPGSFLLLSFVVFRVSLLPCGRLRHHPQTVFATALVSIVASGGLFGAFRGS